MSYEDEAFKLAEVLDVLLWDIDGRIAAEDRDPVWYSVSQAQKALAEFRKLEKQDAGDKATFAEDYRSRHPEG